MVAVVAGNGLGLGNTSLGQLGQAAGGQAGVGQAGMDQYLNIANGNLVLRDPGQSLIFDGTSLDMLRTYNSQGQLTGDNGWLFGFGRTIGGLTGTLNTDGSTVSRTSDDGSTVVYAYDAVSGDYVSQGQSGTEDRLHWDETSSTWRWTDGATKIVETYDADGRLASLSNPQSGASFEFTWENGRLVGVLAGDGDRLTLGYDANGHLSTLTVSEVPPGGTDAVVRQQASYAYDALGRLISVSTTLASDTATSPGVYTTHYTYDGTSDRIASVTQGDGTTIAYEYVEDDSGNYLVSRIVTGTGDDAQTIDIAYANGNTTIADSLGNVWTYAFSPEGRLVSVGAPPVNGAGAETHYEYDANGNPVRTIDANGAVTHYTYDAHGNLLSVEGPTGETTSYTYDANDQMLTRTVYAIAAQGEVGTPDYVAPSGAQTTHYVYDGAGHLVYVIDPLGSVTRRDFTTDTLGNTVVSSTFAWRDVSFNVAGGEPSLADVDAWESQPSIQSFLSRASRTDYTYDARGQVSSQTVYDVLDASGEGIIGAGTTMTRTTYDASGRLLQSATVRGEARDVVESTSYAYDGMGRIVSSTDALGHATSYVYLDNDHTVEVIDASGLITTRVYNSAGLLISTTQSSGTPPHAGDTFYDAAGRPVVSVDAEGHATYTIYDAEGRSVGTVDADGKLVARTFDANGNLISSVSYANTIDTSGWLAATGPTAELPTTPPIPDSNDDDRILLNVYDSEGRILAAVSDDGAVTVTSRDADGNATAVRTYAAKLSASQVRGLGLTPTIDSIRAIVTAGTNDGRALAVYGEDGLLLASVDETGYVTTYSYDGTGRLTSSSRYTSPITASNRNALPDAPSLAAVTSVVPSSSSIQWSMWIRDEDENLQATVDQDGKVTLYTYIDGVLAATTALDTPLRGSQVTAILASPTYENLLETAGVDPQKLGENNTVTIYDTDGHVAAVVRGDQVTLTTYDELGHISRTTIYYLSSSALTLDLARMPTLSHLQQILAGDTPYNSATNVYDASGNLVAFLQGSLLTYTSSAADSSWKMVCSYDLTTQQVQSLGSQPSLAGVQAIVQGKAPSSINTIEYYNSQGLKIASFGGVNRSASIYDGAGNLLVSMSGAGGPSPYDLIDEGVPVPYEEVVNDKLEVFTHYTFFGDDGEIVATIEANYSWGGDGYGMHPDITYWSTDSARGIAAENFISAAMHESDFDEFGKHPSLGILTDIVVSDSPEVRSATYTNEDGQIIAIVDTYRSTIEIFTYDAQGRKVKTAQYYYPDGLYGPASDLPSLDDITASLDPDDAYVTYAFYVADASGTTTYTVDGGSIEIERRDLGGHLISEANYDDLSDDSIAKLGESPSASTLLSLIKQDGLEIYRVNVGDGDEPALPQYAYGELLFVSTDVAGTRIISRVDVDVDQATLLKFTETGDASSILAKVGGGAELYTQSVQLTDDQGRIVALVDGNSGASFWSYDNEGRITSHYDVIWPDMDAVNALEANLTVEELREAVGYSGVSTSIYDDRGNEIASVSWSGEVKTYHYDDAGRLLSTVSHSTTLTGQQVSELSRDPSMAVLEADLTIAGGARIDQSIRDAQGQVVATIDGDGNVRRYEYDSAGRVRRVTEYATPLASGFGLISNLDVLDAELQPSIDDRVTITVYDGLGHPAAEIDPDGVLTVTNYDAEGHAASTVRYAAPLSRQQIASLGLAPSLVQVLRMLNGRSSYIIYGQTGRPTATIDQQGRASFAFYDAQGRLSASVDGGGALTTFVYDANGAVIASTSYATAVDTTAWYDVRTGILSIPSEAPTVALTTGDRTTLTLRDPSGNVLAEVDPAGAVTRFVYDGAGRLIASTVGARILSAEEFASLGFAPTISDLDAIVPPSATDRTNRTIFDAAGYPAMSIDAAGYVTRRSYDSLGNVTMVRRYADPLDSGELESLGASSTPGEVNILLTESQDDLVNRTFYDATGRTVATIDEEGFLTTWIYDEQGHTQVSTRHAAALTVTQLATITGRESVQDLQAMLSSDADAQSTQDAFDALGELVDHIDASGAETQYTYDAAGRQTGWSTQDTFGSYSAQKEYDAFGDLVSATNGAGDVTTSVWDEFGRLVSTTDGAGNKTWYIYDRAGRLAYKVEGRAPEDGVANALGAVTSFTYDVFGELQESRVYANLINLTGAYEGDALNPEAASAQSLGAWLSGRNAASAVDETTQYTYTKSGQVASKTDGEGYLTQYVYDSFGELVSTTQQVSGNHNPIDATNSVTTEYTYDARGERIGTTEALGTALQRSTVTAYDAFGRATSVTDPSGHVTNYEFDRLGRQIALFQTVGGAVSRTAVTYDAFDRVVMQTDPMGHVTTFSYDVSGHAMTVTTPEGVSMTTVHDSLGDVVSVTDSDGNGTTYSYDAAGRLIETRDAGGAIDTVTYDKGGTVAHFSGSHGESIVTYDGVGRLLSRVVNPEGDALTTTYTYDGAGRVVAQADPLGFANFAYDADGRLTRSTRFTSEYDREVASFVYDGLGRVTIAAAGTGSDTQITRFEFDTLGRRVSQVVDPDGLALTTRYEYDTADHLLRAIDPSGAVSSTIYDEAGRLIYSMVPTGAVGSGKAILTLNTYDLDGEIVASVTYATAIDSSVLDGSEGRTTSDLLATGASLVPGSSVDDTHVYTVRDNGGRPRFVIDASGVVTETRYDALGHIAATLVYAKAITPDATLATALLAGTAQPSGVALALETAGNDAADARAEYDFYDAAGRIAYVVRAVDVGGTLQYMASGTTYTADGQVLADTVFTKPLSTDSVSQASTDSIAEALAYQVNDGSARVTTRIYDSAKRHVATVGPDGSQSFIVYGSSGKPETVIDGAGGTIWYGYDFAGRIVSERHLANTTDTEGWLVDGVITENFGAGGVYTSQSDEDVETVYDTAGRLSYVYTMLMGGNESPNLGGEKDYQYDSAGRLTAEFDKSVLHDDVWDTHAGSTKQERMTRYFYDAGGNRIATLEADGILTVYSNDAAGRVIASTTYANPVDVDLRYDDNLSDITPTASPDDQTTTYFRDDLGRVTGSIDPEGYLNAYTYDAAGRVTSNSRYGSFVPPELRSDLASALSIATNGKVERTSSTFDDFGRLVSSINVEGTETTYSYNLDGRLIERIVAADTEDARTTTFEYDALGRVSAQTDAVGARTVYTYDVNGRIATATDGLGNTTWTVYDGAGNLAYTIRGIASQDGNINARGEVTESRYDGRGQIVDRIAYATTIDLPADFSPGLQDMDAIASALDGASDDADFSESFEYDSMGHVTHYTGNTEYTASYDGFGELIYRTNGYRDYFNNEGTLDTTYEYDETGHLVRQHDMTPVGSSGGSVYTSGGYGAPIDATQTWTYDAFGRAVKYVDANGATSNYRYDAFGDKIDEARMVDGELRETTQQYDAFGRVTSRTDAMGLTTTFAYDDAARTVITTFPDGLSTTVTHNREGQQISFVDQTGGVTSYSYDAAGRLIDTQQPDGTHLVSEYDVLGNLVRGTDAGGLVVTYTYDAAGRVLTQTVDPDGLRLTTTYAYDGSGLQVRMVDAAGAETTYRYDESGHVAEMTVVGAGAPEGASPELDVTYEYDVAGYVTAEYAVGADGDDKVIYEKHDPFGRLLYSNAGGIERRFAYDANGNMRMSSDGQSNTYYAYNDAGELIWKVVPAIQQGYTKWDAVTGYTYDADGNLLSTTQYETMRDDGDLSLFRDGLTIDWNVHQALTAYEAAEQLSEGSSPGDRTNFRVYDTLGRLVYEIDPQGLVTETRYDALQRPIETIAYDRPIVVDAAFAEALAAGEAGLPAVANAVASAGNDSAGSRATRSFYDAFGRVLFTTVEADMAGVRTGLVTEFHYDADGRVTSKLAHDASLTGAQLSTATTASLTAWAALAPGGVGSHTVYDAAGRPAFVVDENGFVQQIGYDGDGRVTSSYTYAHAISPAAWEVADVAAAVAAANPSATDVRGTSTTYDGRGNVLSVSVPGSSQPIARYTYDGMGNKTSYTDRDGNTWIYTYSGSGLLEYETSPSVEVVDTTSEPPIIVTGGTVTSYFYDQAGRVAETTVTAPNGHSTRTYTEYDPSGQVIRQSSDAGTIEVGTHYVTNRDAIVTQSRYDVFGQLTSTIDPNGNASYKVYDHAGHLVYDIDPEGYVTGYTYDSFGDVTGTTRYANALDLSAIIGWDVGVAPSLETVQENLLASSSDRSIHTEYDGFGRKVSVTQTAVSYAHADGSPGVGTPTTRFTYDVRGRVTSTSTLVDGVADQSGAVWATTYTWYDAEGRLTMSVDPMGYVTTWSYNGFGDVTGQTDYATPVATSGLVPGGVMPGVTAGEHDRSTTWTYDQEGRKASESVLRDYTDASGNAVRGYVTTTYGYDGENRVISISEGGRTIVTSYDALGRIQSVTAPAERVLVANWKEQLQAHPSWDLTTDALYVSGAQVVTYGYDASGNKTVQTQQSTAGGPSQSTWYLYDAAGRLMASTSPAANGPLWGGYGVTFYTYDQDRNVVSSVSWLSNEGGMSGRTQVTTSYTYDATGRQTSSSVQRGDSGTPDAATNTRYDAFGEVIATGNGIVDKGSSTYDAAGRQITAVDPATGVQHSYVYDLAGKLIQDTYHATGGALVYTRYTRDLDGNILSQLTPSTTSATGESAAPQTATYDRWGNVLTTTDALGNVTTYTYNERNQLVSTSGPQVTAVDASGNAAVVTPVKTTSYDIDGNVVAITDENGNVVRTVYDAAGQVVDVIDAAGAHTLVAYDSLGNEVAGQTGLRNGSEDSLHITFKEVDGQGRTIDEGDFFNDGTGYKATLRQVYVLDEAGNRVVVFDGLGSAALQANDQATANRHATYYAYDSQGRVIASQTGAQRDFSQLDPSNYPPPVQQPRNMDFEQGDFGWTSAQEGVWTIANGTATYVGNTDDSIRFTNDDGVPVTPGQVINGWADLWSTGNHGGSAVNIDWYRADGSYIGGVGGNIQTTDDGRGLSTVRGVAPAGAAFARISIGASNSSNAGNKTTCYGVGWDYVPPDGGLSPILDGSIFVSLPSTTFSMQPLNPDFENGASGWDLPPGWDIHQADNTANGDWIATFTGTSPSTMTNKNRAPVVPGQKITAHAQIALDERDGGDPAGALLILWYDKDGNLIRYNSSNVISNGNNGQFESVSVTDVAPPGAAYATIGLSGNGNGAGFAVFDAISWDYRYIPSLDPGATINTFTYDVDGNLVAQTNADGDSESWVRDAYGRITDHTDLAGATYHYTYDAYSGLQLTESDNWGSVELGDITVPGYVQGAHGTGNSETRTYNAAGQVTSITYGDGSSYSYAYDGNGNQVRQEATTVDGNGQAVHTVTTTTYDSHGRISQVTSDDGTAVLAETYTYDAVGNRRSIVATVTAGGVTRASTTSWYDYDADNRVTVSDGDLVNGAITIAARSTSYGMSYDAAGNLAARTTRSGGTLLSQRNFYDARGQLMRADYASTLGDPNAWRGVAETRTYDNNGNVVTDDQYYMLGSTANQRYNPKLDPDSPDYIGGGAGTTPGADIGGMLSTATITRYDSYGRVGTEQTFGHDQYWDGTGGDTTPEALPAANATTWSGMSLQSAVLYQGPGGSSAYDAMGNVVFYQYRVNSTRLDQYTVTYLKKEGYLESATSGQNITNLANVRPATDESYYNVRGERIAIAQHTQYAFGTVADTVRAFAYDGNGQIISRRDGTANGNAIDQGADPSLKNQHYVYVNGQQVAHYDEKNTVDVLSQVTAFSSGTGAGDYVVQEGDTLKSIAQAVYGNASLWYIVAQANALTGDNDLAVGLSLSIPAVTTTKNDATTFKPYNPSEIQGSTTPDMPVIAPPPPPPKHHCNVIAAVIVIAVVVVASIVTAGAAAAAFGSTLAGTIGTAAATAAAGSAAGQLAGDALGTHHGFSFGEVFTSAATAAVTAGVGYFVSGGSSAAAAVQSGTEAGQGASTVAQGISWSQFGAQAAEAAEGYVAQAGVAKLVGQPSHFSWAGLVSTSLAGGVSTFIGPSQQQIQVGQVGTSGWRVGASTLLEGAVQREASIALGDGRVPSWEAVGENAAGKAVGAYVASELASGPSPSPQESLASWNRNGGGLSAYGELATGGSTYSLLGGDQSPAVNASYAYLDNGSALRSYSLTSYAGSAAASQEAPAYADPLTAYADVRDIRNVALPGKDNPLTLYGNPGMHLQPTAIPFTADAIPNLASVGVHANAPGIVDEHYDPVWAQQQAALAAQQSAMDAANQQRLSDFFNDQALHIVASPIYALSGAVKEGVNGGKWLGHQILEGGRFQATKYAALGAAARGDVAGMEAADRLGAQIVADTTKPVAPVFHVSEFEHAAAIAVAPINPEEAAVAGISLVERLTTGVPGVVDLAAGVNVTRAGASADGIMAARGGFEATEGAISPTMASTADDLGIAARYEPGEVMVDEQRLVSNGMYREVASPVLDREIASQIAVTSGLDLANGSRVMAADAGGFHYVSSNGVRGEVPLSAAQRAEVDTYLDMFDLDGVAIRHVDDTNLNTGYLHGEMFSILNVGSDVVPGNIGLGTLTANSRIGIRGTIAHEIVGHREAALAGQTQSINALEEAQASIRAARFAPGLTSTERFTLLRDGITRLYNAGLKIRDYRDMLYIEQR